MTIAEVIVLREAADDLEIGRWFYDGIELGDGRLLYLNLKVWSGDLDHVD